MLGLAHSNSRMSKNILTVEVSGAFLWQVVSGGRWEKLCVHRALGEERVLRSGDRETGLQFSKA